MKIYLQPLVIFCVGIWLFVIGLQMAGAAVQSSSTTSNIGTNSAIGAGLGGVAGFCTWLAVGTIGVATGGTAIAIGAVAFTLFGLGAGSLAGAATGSTHTVVQSAPLYSPWAYGTVIVVGLLLAFFSLRAIKRIYLARRTAKQLTN